MIALTAQDFATGWFTIGAVSMLVGIGTIWLGRSLWSEVQAQKAERIVAETDQERVDRIVDAAVARSEREMESMLHVLDLVEPPRLTVVADVVPLGRVPKQRDGGESA